MFSSLLCCPFVYKLCSSSVLSSNVSFKCCSTAFTDGSTLYISIATCFFCPVWIGTSVLTNSICAFPPQLSVSTLLSDPYSSYCSVIGQDAILWPPPYENRSVVSVVLATWGSASTCDCAANVTAAPMHRRQTILRSNIHCPSAVIGPCLDAYKHPTSV